MALLNKSLVVIIPFFMLTTTLTEEFNFFRHPFSEGKSLSSSNSHYYYYRKGNMNNLWNMKSEKNTRINRILYPRRKKLNYADFSKQQRSIETNQIKCLYHSSVDCYFSSNDTLDNRQRNNLDFWRDENTKSKRKDFMERNSLSKYSVNKLITNSDFPRALAIRDDYDLNFLYSKTQHQESIVGNSKRNKCITDKVEGGYNKRYRKQILILGLFDLSTGNLNNSLEREEITAAFMAMDHLNRINLLGCEYELRIAVNDTKGDGGIAINNLLHAMHEDVEKEIKLVFECGNANVTYALGKVCSGWNLPLISYGLSHPELNNRSKYPMFYNFMISDASHNWARIAFLSHFNWSVVTTFCQHDYRYTWGFYDLTQKLENAKITLHEAITFNKVNLLASLHLLKEQGSKVILASFSERIAPKIFCLAYKQGLYGKDFVWILPGTWLTEWWNNERYCNKKDMLEATNGLIFLSLQSVSEEDMEMEYPQIPVESAVKNFKEIYDAIWTVGLSLRKTIDTCKPECDLKEKHGKFQEDLQKNLQSISFKGKSGPVKFRGAERVCVTTFQQIQNGNLVTIGKYYPEKDKVIFNCSRCINLRWPSGNVPSVKAHYQQHTIIINSFAFYTITFFSFIGIILSLIFLVFNIRFRSHKYIKLSSPYLNTATILGCILVYLDVIFLGLDSFRFKSIISFETVCTARVTFLSSGFSLAFGSVFAKTYRIHQIFVRSNIGIVRSKILQDSRLLPLLGMLTLIDAVIIVLWQIVDPMRRDFYDVTSNMGISETNIIHQTQVETCYSDYKVGWLFAICFYKSVFFIGGLYMAWETRNVKIPALNDSVYIGYSLYGVVITCTLAFWLGNVNTANVTVTYVITTVPILITTTSSLLLLFVPKICAILKKDSVEGRIMESLGLKIEANTIRFVKDDEHERWYRAEVINDAYRKDIYSLEREVTRLQQMLYFPNMILPVQNQRNRIYDKLPGFKRYSRSKSSSLCEGIPVLMLSMFPVVVPRASWPCGETGQLEIEEESSQRSDSNIEVNASDDMVITQIENTSQKEDEKLNSNEIIEMKEIRHNNVNTTIVEAMVHEPPTCYREEDDTEDSIHKSIAEEDESSVQEIENN